MQVEDFPLRSVEPLFQLDVGDFHLLGGVHQAFDDGAQAFAVLRLADLFRHADQALGVAVGGTGGAVDHRHHLLDFALDLAADLVDPLG